MKALRRPVRSMTLPQSALEIMEPKVNVVVSRPPALLEPQTSFAYIARVLSSRRMTRLVNRPIQQMSMKYFVQSFGPFFAEFVFAISVYPCLFAALCARGV